MKIRQTHLATIVSFLILTMFGCGNPEAELAEKQRLDSLEIAEKLATKIADSLAEATAFNEAREYYIRTNELREKYLGFKYVFPANSDFLAENGSAKGLDGTDGNYFIAYFEKGDLTVVMNKKTDRFENICSGRNSNLKYDQTAKLSKLLNKRMKYYDFQEHLSSTRYGKTERLGQQNCFGVDCCEYYPKGNFTVITLFESGEGERADMKTLKKIAMGKVPRLADF